MKRYLTTNRFRGAVDMIPLQYAIASMQSSPSIPQPSPDD